MKFFYEEKGNLIQISHGEHLEFGAHLHSHLEIVYMLEGRSKVLIDAQEYEFGEGDILVIFPNQLHQYYRISNENYIILIFPQDLCPEYREVFQLTPQAPVVKNGENSPRYLSYFEQLCTVKDLDSEYQHSILRGFFLVLLGNLFSGMEFSDNCLKSGNNDMTKAIIQYCAEHYREDIVLDDIAEALHINKYYVSHLFSSQLKMNFKYYIGMLRVSEACGLLGDKKKSITDVAFQSGFQSTRSFNRAFMEHIGISPRDYRKKHKKYQVAEL